MTCIIHYEGQENYDEDLLSVTNKTAKKILLAKSMHQASESNDHKEQCKSINSEKLVGMLYHKKPCYNKFVRITRNSNIKLPPATSTKSSVSQPHIPTTRSKRKSNTKFDELPSTKRKKVNVEIKPRQSRRSNSTLASSSSRNQFVFGEECVLCETFELRYKNSDREEVREYPQPLTLDMYGTKIKEQLQKKEEYKHVADKVLPLNDLIAAEFKYHDYCRKKLMTDQRETSNRGRPNAGFKKVIEHVDEYVVNMNQVVSMNILYDFCYKDFDEANKKTVTKRKQRLKTMITEQYGDSVLIVGTRDSHPEVLIHSQNIDSKMTVNSHKEPLIKNAARYLRQDIIEFCKKLPPMSWPPTLEEILSDTRAAPPSSVLFLTSLLKNPKHAVTDRIRRLINSFSADFVYGVSGEITGKHYLMGHGLHSLTGNKETVQIANRLGHSISYDQVLDIETAQARKALQLMNSADKSILPLQPEYPTQTINIVFWADNCNMKVDTEAGGGAVEITTIMAFQEETVGAVQGDRSINVPKTKSRNIVVEFENHDVIFYDKQEPRIFDHIEGDTHDSVREFELKFFTWLYLRYSNRNEQIHPKLSGMLLRLRQKDSTTKIAKTVETYLPPLPTKVTDPQTIYSYLVYFQALAKEMNMPYVNVTLDVGAAINAYKLVWKYSQQFSNVVIHLGDFHVLKENFKIMGLLLQSSGFEEIVYEGRLCTSGSMCGVMNGTHYNRAWKIHEVMSEALERIVLKRFLHEVDPSISDDLIDLASEESDGVDRYSIRSGESLKKEFDDYQKKVRRGYLGKTAQFWLIYIDLMRLQRQYHTAVQENDFELRLASIEAFLPYYFYYNMHNYARYASYYVQVLKSIDLNQPGLKDLLLSSGLSVQSQDRYPLRTAIDMRGEQTLNRDAKTSGGITYFAASTPSVQKWALNRSDAAESKKALRSMTGLSEPNTVYKSLRPSQILNSEKRVSTVMSIIENDYINPFGLSVDKDNLLNIGSGVSVPQPIADGILQQVTKGKELAEAFKNDRLFTTNIKFHQSISKNDCKQFKEAKKTCIVKSKTGGQATVEVNRNILGALNSFSLKTGVAVDYKKALVYPLNPCPLSICHADGRKRSNKKSDLKDILLDHETCLTASDVQNIQRDAVVVDMMGVINVIKTIPDTYQELAEVFVGCLPRSYRRVDIVADSYGSVKLFKNGVVGDQADKILIPSLKSRVHPDYSSVVLRNRENKTRLVELIFEYIEKNAESCFEKLGSKQIVLSSEERCVTITSSDSGDITVELNTDLLSNHDEGDTKVVLHANAILLDDPDTMVTIRSPSGDTDIVVLAVAHLYPHAHRIVLDDFHGNGQRKWYPLSKVDLDEDIIDALIGFHAFTGNDFVSSFFRKGKNTCFKLLSSSSKFKEAFSLLGSSWDLTDDIFYQLQSFVLHLYGMKKAVDVDAARYKLFKKKYDNEEKTVDMSTLPPCQSVLRLHCERAHFLAALWKRATISQLQNPDPSHYGWNQDKTIMWVDEVFPAEVESILLDPRFDPDDVEEAYGESDDEELPGFD